MKLEDAIGTGLKVLWVVNAGGHLSEAIRLSARIGASSDSLWVTPETSHAQGHLAGARTRWVPYVKPRDLRGSVRTARIVRDLVAREHFDVCISTGAALAALALPLVRIRGIRTVFVESLARPNGFSLTGRMLNLVPGVDTLTQYRHLERRSWRFSGTILDGYSRRDLKPRSPRRIFVTLGTIRPYRFDRLVDAVLSIVEPGDHIVWQLGGTSREDLPGESHVDLSPERLRREVERADVVITHAGIGTILDVLDAGKVPLLAPRMADHGEHVDAHQADITRVLTESGLALGFDLERPKREILNSAAAVKVERGGHQ
ncbi:glycosyltransferase [Microbacterium esteraromaticum]|uniref:glycosyltransferase n=1 Tax=Microbacterium esteraromaticum TaxID=57043 RepID=UPI003C2CB781